MTAVDYILDGLEAELALERELGVRSFECDRSLLAVKPEPPPVAIRPAPAPQSPAPRVSPPAPRAASSAPLPPCQASGARRDFIFIHDRALSPKGVEMMAKIITALGRTEETAPVVIVPPLPDAKVYVVLGGLAMRKFFPGMHGEPGQWLKAENGADVLVTYSPEYILRFGTVTPAVLKMKQSMWLSLKAVLQRVRLDIRT